MEDTRTGGAARRVAGQYTSGGLCERVVTLLAEHGLGRDNLRREDIEGMDEFHVGGASATRELATFAQIEAGQLVLDIGAGIGGPARRLAEEYGCEVTALDITEEYCRAGGMLTEWLGLAQRVRFVCASAAALPFRNGAFDTAWMQFAGMNVPDKAEMAREINRVLRPGGKFVFHEVLAGEGGEPVFPVFWADEPSMSFLVGLAQWEGLFRDAGFAVGRVEEVSAEAVVWYEQIAGAGKGAKEGPLPLNVGVIVDREVGKKSRNVRENIESGRIRIYRGVFERG